MSTPTKLSVLALCMLLGTSAPAFAQQPQPERATKYNVVGNLQIEEREDGTYIRLSGSSVPTFSVFKMSDPARLFVDISNSALKDRPGAQNVSNGVISQVALLNVRDSAQAVTRVIIGFESVAHYDVRTEGSDVVIFIDGTNRKKVAPATDAKSAAELAQQQARYNQAVANLEQTRQRLSQTEQELNGLQAKLKSATGKERQSLQGQIAALDKERTQAQGDAAAAKQRAELAQREAQQLKSKLSAAEQQTQVLATKLNETQGQQRRLNQDLEQAQSRADQASAQLAQQTSELQQTRKRAQELSEQLSSLRKQAASGDVQAREQLVSLEREQLQLKSKLDAARSERERAQREATDARELLKQLQAQLIERDQQLKVARAQLANNDKARAALPAAKAVDATSPNLVRDIRLEQKDGRSRIVVELTRQSKFETLPGRDSRAVMILNDVKLPQSLERTLTSRAQGGAVRFVSSFVDGKQVRMEAELKGQTAETIFHNGNTIVWEFAPMVAAAQEEAAPTIALAKNSQVKDLAQEQPQRPIDGDSYTSAPPELVVDPSKVNRVRGMGRKRLTIDLRDADIQNVLRLVAKEGGVNIIAGDDVKGTVTMSLRQVMLDQVFLTILQSKSLGYEMRGNVIRVAPQKTLIEEESTRQQARENRRKLQPLEVFLLPISYASAKDLVPQVQGLLSSRGSVTVDERTNTIIIKDISENLEPIRVLIESLDSQVPQVLIEGRIVETNDAFSQQLGIQWGGIFGANAQQGNSTGLVFPANIGLAGAAADGQTPNLGVGNFANQPNYAINLPAAVGTGSGGGIGLSLGSIGGSTVLNLRLTALESAGHARIVSSPKILTLDNRTATISQGTSIPISVVSAAGVQTVFVDATLELTVTPHVTPDGNIQLKIKATKNEPDFQNTGARGDPTILRRQAETELLIKDGDTTVIGGIYTRNTGSSISAVPFFHKVPILGYFFRTSSESERRNELLIFITPRIVNRAESLGAGSAGSVRQEDAAPASGNAAAPAAANP